ncbi:MAG: hypothetical protein ACOYUZ_02695 [Patescibacteria group bacterium]
MSGKKQETRIEIQDVKVFKPDGWRLHGLSQVFLDMHPKKDGAFVLWVIFRSAYDMHYWTKPLMGIAKFKPVASKPIHEQTTAFLRNLIHKQNARISVHNLDPKVLNTAVSLMYDEEHQKVYHAVRGDPRGMDNKKNPKVSELLPFFEKV